MPYVAQLINHIRDRIYETAYLVSDRKPRFFDVGIRYIVFNVMSATVRARRHGRISVQYGQDMPASWLIGKRLPVTPKITA